MRSRNDHARRPASHLVHAVRRHDLRVLCTRDVLPNIPLDPARWREVLLMLLAQNNGAHGHKPKGVSNSTKQERKQFLFTFFRELRHAPGLHFRMDPRSLAGRHVQYAVDQWVAAGLSAGTIQNRLSLLRVFASWIGKDGMVLDATHYVKDPSLITRTYVAKQDRSWSAKGIGLSDVLTAVDLVDARVGAQLRMCGAFGLRVKESLMCRPRLAAVDGRLAVIQETDFDRYLEVKRGSKGGRLRYVPIDTDLKRDVLAYAGQVVMHDHESLAHPTLSLKEAYWRFYTVVRGCGLTRSELGVTAHGLRHEYAADRYESAAGVPGPLRGGIAPNWAIDDAARLSVAHELGHGRKQISAAYLGGVGSRAARRRRATT